MNPINPLIKYGIIALIFGALVSGIYYEGYKHGAKKVQSAWDIEVKNDAVYDAKVADENLKKVQDAQNIGISAANNYEGKLNAIKSYYSKHPVMLSNRVCDATKSVQSANDVKVPVTAASADENTKNDVPIAAIDLTEINWDNVAQDCAETTLQTISLQNWLTTEINNFNAESK